MKRLDDALAAGDNIRAVIRGSGINQDGKTSGIAMPNQVSQEGLGRAVYEQTKLDPTSVGYVEAHGTGTVAGDSAESSSISNIFCGEKRKTPLYVGSIKSNIGHLEAGSGIAGLLKTVLVLEKGQIPPNINLEQFKEGLDFEQRNIKVLLFGAAAM